MQSNDRIFVSQVERVREILNKFKINNCNSTNTSSEFNLKAKWRKKWEEGGQDFLQQIVGNLMYIIVIRPNIMYFVSLISKYMTHLTHVSCYENTSLSIRSTLGYFFMLDIRTISWSSTKQPLSHYRAQNRGHPSWFNYNIVPSPEWQVAYILYY